MTSDETPFDVAMREAKVLTFIRCGGSGGHCNQVYGAVVDDGTDNPPVIYQTGQPCRHRVNAFVLDWRKVDELVKKGRVALKTNKRPPSYHLPVQPGRQLPPLEQMKMLAAEGKADLHEASLIEGPGAIASRTNNE